MNRAFCRFFLLNLFLFILTITTAFSQQPDPTFGTNGVVFTTVTSTSPDPFSRNSLWGLKGFPRSTGGFTIFARNQYLFSIKLPPSDGTGLINYGENGSMEGMGPFTDRRIGVDAAQQPDGKIVAVGNTNQDWFIQRFNTNGALDTGFNSTGSRVLGFGGDNIDQATNVLVQPDGKILISGSSSGQGQVVTLVVRLNPDGTDDTTFGPYGNGILILFDNGALSQEMALRPNGKILLMNMSLSNPPLLNETRSMFFQLNSDGSPDSGFGDAGLLYAFEPHQNRLTETKVQPDGKLVVLTTRDFIVPGMTDTHDQEIVVTRYNTDGSLDTAFGENGKSVVNTSPPRIGTPPFYEPNGTEEAQGLVIDSTGKIDVVLMSLQVTPALWAPPSGYIGHLEQKYIEYILQFGTNGQLTGRNFSRQTKYNQVVQANTPIDINGIFEQPGKGPVIYGTYYENAYYQNAPRLSTSVILARFSSISAVNDANNFYDYTFDGQADFPTYRVNATGFGNWRLAESPAPPQEASYDFGLNGDVPVPGDYDGDGIQDLAVFRPSAGDWFTRKIYLDNCGPMDCITQIHFGSPGDIPATGDFDADGKSDRAVFRPSEGNWYILFANGSWTGLHFGQNGDLPVTGDYDDDGKSDVAVIRRENGHLTWYILQSSNNQFVGIQFGLNTDKAVPADYNGDGRTEVAVWRPTDGNWYLLSNYTDFSAVSWGTNGDIPGPADYDGDQKADFAIFRPSEGTHYVLRSHDASLLAYHSGSATDIPIASVYVR